MPASEVVYKGCIHLCAGRRKITFRFGENRHFQVGVDSIKHAQILLKLDKRPENEEWTYDRIKEAYGASHNTIAGVAKRFVMEGMEAALGRKEQKNRCRKVTGDVEAQICLIACSKPPEGASRWTMQAIANELIRLEVVDYITDSTVCEVMKKTKSSRGRSKNGVSPRRTRNL